MAIKTRASRKGRIYAGGEGNDPNQRNWGTDESSRYVPGRRKIPTREPRKGPKKTELRLPGLGLAQGRKIKRGPRWSGPEKRRRWSVKRAQTGGGPPFAEEWPKKTV